jgi:hypothetical protein
MARQVRSLDAQDTLAVADRLPELDVPARVVWESAAAVIEVVAEVGG